MEAAGDWGDGSTEGRGLGGFQLVFISISDRGGLSRLWVDSLLAAPGSGASGG